MIKIPVMCAVILLEIMAPGKIETATGYFRGMEQQTHVRINRRPWDTLIERCDEPIKREMEMLK